MVRRAVRSLIGTGFYVGLAFVGAGRIDWPRGVVFAALFVSASVIGSLVVELRNPALLAARDKGLRRESKPFDRLFYALFLPLVLAVPLIAGLDAGRFLWSPLPLATLPAGVVLLLAGAALTTWTLAVNAHAEATVRIQTDRDHKVVSDGPYRLVRHPMYLGTIIGLPAMALIVGSGMALLPAALMAILFVWRTGREDATLCAELDGYRSYAEKTRFRLLPGIW
jgi:protein-S-isoprenylcysteine O-methyltransferase Ste14